MGRFFRLCTTQRVSRGAVHVVAGPMFGLVRRSTEIWGDPSVGTEEGMVVIRPGVQARARFPVKMTSIDIICGWRICVVRRDAARIADGPASEGIDDGSMDETESRRRCHRCRWRVNTIGPFASCPLSDTTRRIVEERTV